MYKFKLVCTYCNHSWVQSFYTKGQVEYTNCKKCNDENLIVKDYASDIIDQYADKPLIKKEKKNEQA